MPVYLKVYNIDREVLVAVADEDCVGKKFTDEQVSLDVSKDFYGTRHADHDEIVSALQEATIANIVGKESVALAVENGFINFEDVIFVEDVPHAQMILCA
ncbi:MAG TPA: DUF424 family protein [Methanocellaceae archaeon]|jgi:uncharacterized protein